VRGGGRRYDDGIRPVARLFDGSDHHATILVRELAGTLGADVEDVSEQRALTTP